MIRYLLKMKFLEVFMDNYRMMYYTLFNAITKAIEAQAESNYGISMNILMTAQQDTEKIFMNVDKTDEVRRKQ